MKPKALLVILLAVVIVESTLLGLPLLSRIALYQSANAKTFSQSATFPFSVFNNSIKNDTEHELEPPLKGSWEVDIRSSLIPSSTDGLTEAEIAFAPAYPTEYQSIPTIIIQQHGNGVLRVEYFAQNWPNSSGLLLYNSNTPGWIAGKEVSMVFQSTGPPSEVNPQLAPRPNGAVDIRIGDVTVVSSYPIAWANLSDLYLFGFPGSTFIGGTVQINFYTV